MKQQNEKQRKNGLEWNGSRRRNDVYLYNYFKLCDVFRPFNTSPLAPLLNSGWNESGWGFGRREWESPDGGDATADQSVGYRFFREAIVNKLQFRNILTDKWPINAKARREIQEKYRAASAYII